MKIHDLNLRNTSKKNLNTDSRKAVKNQIIAKTGITQDALGYMNVEDIPSVIQVNGEEWTIGELLLLLLGWYEETEEVYEESK